MTHLPAEHRFVANPARFHRLLMGTIFGPQTTARRIADFELIGIRFGCFVLMTIAGLSLVSSPSLLAQNSTTDTSNTAAAIISESPGASSESTKTTVATHNPGAPIRLHTTAGASGWLGPVPYQTPNRRDAQAVAVARSVAAIPPPAPPTQPPLPDTKTVTVQPPAAPEPVSPSPDTTSRTVSHHSLNTVAAISHADRLTDIAVELLEGARVPLIEDAPPVPAAIVPAAMQPGTPETTAMPVRTDTPGSSRHRIRPQTTKQPADTRQPDSPPPVTTPPTATHVQEETATLEHFGPLEITRPLNQVSLSESQRPEDLNGESLNEPEDRAARLFSEFGTFHEAPRLTGVPAPRRNYGPVYYNPLYFEDPNLERCGIGYGCMTEIVSAVRFFGRVPLLPYMKASVPHDACVASLGDCPTCHAFGGEAYLPPLNVRGIAAQAAWSVGMVFLIP